ncbi:hypothetical protein Peur_020255 [Populus x canadensis]
MISSICFSDIREAFEALEAHDGASKGKYTIGLGQDCMGFCTEVEDVISMSLTAVSSLLEKYNVDPKQIGRLEVGSETVIDKSKSIKNFLMQIFEVYAERPARPTGGAAAIAMLIVPDAPITFESKFRGSHMSHAYDFYKPNLASEYPVHIVYMGERRLQGDFSPASTHHSMLAGILGSYESAKKSLVYSYGRSFDGFARQSYLMKKLKNYQVSCRTNGTRI